jgi:chromosome partitioning protein
MATIAIFNQKGGVGKTTTCLNLTAGLTRSQRGPVVIDLDPQAHMTLASGIREVKPDESVVAFFKNGTPLDRLVKPTAAGWDIVPATLELAKIDVMLGNDAKAGSLLKNGLAQELALTGAPILIDCCPMLGVLTLNALLAADRVLIPVSADFLSLQGVHRLEVALNVLEGKLKRKIERRVVVTRFDARRKLAFEIFDKVRDRYGDLVCNTRISENVALATSPMHGQDIFTFAPSSPGAADYKALTLELLRTGFFD